MAIYATGPLIGSISGDVGGINFANARGSKIIRVKKRRVHLKKDRQLNAQTLLQNTIHEWQALTVRQKNAWRTYAISIPINNRLGISRPLSGYQQFLRINLWLLSIGRPSITPPPRSVPPPIIFNVNFTAGVASGIDMSYEGNPPHETLQGVFYGQRLFKNNLVKFNNSWRFIALLQLLTGTPSSLDVFWLFQYPLPILDEVIALRFVPTTTDSPTPYPPIDQIVKTTA